MSKCAIVTNDLQYGIAYKNEKRKKATEVFLPVMKGFLKEMREHNIPILHLQLIIPEDDPRSNPDIDYVPLYKGAETARILEECYEPSDIVIEKNKDSGFYETALDERLKEMEIDTIVLTGMQTQICIQTTAADGYFRGYNVVVPPDGVMSAREEDKQRAIDWLGSYCSIIMDTAEISAAIKENLEMKFEVVPIP